MMQAHDGARERGDWSRKTLVEPIYFDCDKSALSDAYRAKLDAKLAAQRGSLNSHSYRRPRRRSRLEFVIEST